MWWAKSYLDHAGLLRSPRRGRFHITDRGRAVLQEAPSHLDITFLERFEEFREFRRASNQAEPVSGQVTPERELQGRETPEETLERAYQTIRTELATELLARVKASSPSFSSGSSSSCCSRWGMGGAVPRLAERLVAPATRGSMA